MKLLISSQQKIFKVRQKPGDKDHIQGTDVRGKEQMREEGYKNKVPCENLQKNKVGAS